MNDALLLIFVKKPVAGNVKTRLAASIGDEKALTVYQSLLNHTQKIVEQADVHAHVYYADEPAADDNWNAFEKRQQSGHDLGERMASAFRDGFNAGFRRIVIIGSDTFDLLPEHLHKAFDLLRQTNTVIGPALDGGYYLLGMNLYIPELFLHKKWSTESVCRATIEDIQQQQFTYRLLPVLNDIDTVDDLKGTIFDHLHTHIHKKHHKK